MREIKFRAWDKNKKIMLPKFPRCCLKAEEQFEGYTIGDIDNYEGWFELMQYTGLKDKNGKEIYEGDIVSVNEVGLEDKTNYEVKYFDDDGYPAFDLVGWCGDANGLSEISQGIDWEMEVIGNIYENKELIN